MIYTYEQDINVIGKYVKETEYQGKTYKNTYVYYTSKLNVVEGLYCDSCRINFNVDVEINQNYKVVICREKTETGTKKIIVSAQLIK